MEKILLAIDAANLEMPALDFACYIGRLTNSKITGIFLENVKTNERRVLRTVFDSEGDSPVFFHQETKNYRIEKNVALFKEACERRSVNCTIHRDRGIPCREIIYETRYADLVIVDPSTSFNKVYEGEPSRFVKDLLREAECPVVIAPQRFEGIDEIIFAYDGSKSAAFAIRQFTYLFPQLDDRRIIVVQVNKEGTWTGPDKYSLKEWLQNRYSAIGFEVLKGDTEDKLFDYLLKRKNAMVVMGAYGRNSLSSFLKPSHADLLIKVLSFPLFISHY